MKNETDHTTIELTKKKYKLVTLLAVLSFLVGIGILISGPANTIYCISEGFRDCFSKVYVGTFLFFGGLLTYIINKVLI